MFTFVKHVVFVTLQNTNTKVRWSNYYWYNYLVAHEWAQLLSYLISNWKWLFLNSDKFIFKLHFQWNLPSKIYAVEHQLIAKRQNKNSTQMFVENISCRGLEKARSSTALGAERGRGEKFFREIDFFCMCVPIVNKNITKRVDRRGAYIMNWTRPPDILYLLNPQVNHYSTKLSFTLHL